MYATLLGSKVARALAFALAFSLASALRAACRRITASAPSSCALTCAIMGCKAFLFEGTFADLAHELERGRPVLVGVIKVFSNDAYAHHQIVVGVNRDWEQIVVIDPADGWSVYSFAGFMREWMPTHFLTMAVAPMQAAN